MSQERIDLVISAKNNADRALKSVQGNLKELKNRVFSLKTALAGLGLGLLARDLTGASAEQRRAVAGLETALRSMGRYTPELSGRLQDLAADMQQVTNYADETTLQGQKFLVTYRGITDELLGRSTAAMLDLAALMGGDVTSAANMLGKASMGMTGELRRVGITVDEQTFKLHGYAGVLAEIEGQVAGQARAMRDASGPWIALGNAIGDIKEKAGGVVNDVFGPLGNEVLELLGVLDEQIGQFTASDPFGAWAKRAGDDIVDGFRDALLGSAQVVDAFTPVVETLWDTVQAMWNGFNRMPSWLQEVGLLGALLGGKKGMLLLGAGAGAIEWGRVMADSIDAAKKGYIDWADIVFTPGDFGESGIARAKKLLEDSHYYKIEKEGLEPIFGERTGKLVGWTDPAVEGLKDIEVEAGSAEAAVRKLFELMDQRKKAGKPDAPAAGSGGGATPGGSNKPDKAQQKAEEKVDALITGLLSEPEQLKAELDKRRQVIQDALDAGYIDAEKAEQAQLLLKADYQARLAELEQRGLDAARERREAARAARENEINAALAQIDLGERQGTVGRDEAARRRVELQRELLALQEEHLAQLDKLADPSSWYAQLDAINATRGELVDLEDELQRLAGTLNEGARRGFADWVDAAATAFESGQQLAQDAAGGMQGAFEEFLFDAQRGQLQSLGDYWDMFLATVQRTFAQILSQQIVAGLLETLGLAKQENNAADLTAVGTTATLTGMLTAQTGVVGTLTAAYWALAAAKAAAGALGGASAGAASAAGSAPVVAHTGGLILHDGGPVRLVPRFHVGGLAGDEVPAILQTGERVLSREQNRTFEQLAAALNTSGASGPTEIHIHEAPDTAARVEQSADGQRLDVIIEQVETAIQGRMSRGTGMAPFLDGRYGRRY